MEEEKSALGSPNIFLKKNLERGHIYRGIYVIKDSLRDKFRQGEPIPHLKIRYSLHKEIIEGLKDLTRIANSDDELCEMFVSSMWENLGIKNMEQSSLLCNRMALFDEFGATVLYISDDDVKSLKSFLMAYLKLFQWSLNYRSHGSDPYYPYERYLRLNICLSNIKQWELS